MNVLKQSMMMRVWSRGETHQDRRESSVQKSLQGSQITARVVQLSYPVGCGGLGGCINLKAVGPVNLIAPHERHISDLFICGHALGGLFLLNLCSNTSLYEGNDRITRWKRNWHTTNSSGMYSWSETAEPITQHEIKYKLLVLLCTGDQCMLIQIIKNI